MCTPTSHRLESSTSVAWPITATRSPESMYTMARLVNQENQNVLYRKPVMRKSPSKPSRFSWATSCMAKTTEMVSPKIMNTLELSSMMSGRPVRRPVLA